MPMGGDMEDPNKTMQRIIRQLGLPPELTYMPAYKCLRCGHVWPRYRDRKSPDTCPRCRSPCWFKPSREPKLTRKDFEA